MLAVDELWYDVSPILASLRSAVVILLITRGSKNAPSCRADLRSVSVLVQCREQCVLIRGIMGTSEAYDPRRC